MKISLDSNDRSVSLMANENNTKDPATIQEWIKTLWIAHDWLENVRPKTGVVKK